MDVFVLVVAFILGDGRAQPEAFTKVWGPFVTEEDCRAAGSKMAPTLQAYGEAFAETQAKKLLMGVMACESVTAT